MDEQPRPVANGDEQAYSLTVEDAATLYEAAGHARTTRAIQKYCFRGDLTCIREQTTNGERYRITPASVAVHIEQIEQLSQANRRDQSRPDANVRAEIIQPEPTGNDQPSVREQSRPDAADDRYVTQLEKENAYLRAQNEKKDQQLERRDHQIEAMIQRDQETNVLIQGLQGMLDPSRRLREPQEMHTEPVRHIDNRHEAEAER